MMYDLTMHLLLERIVVFGLLFCSIEIKSLKKDVDSLTKELDECARKHHNKDSPRSKARSPRPGDDSHSTRSSLR